MNFKIKGSIHLSLICTLLFKRIEKAFWLPHCAAAEGVLEQFDKLMKSMEESMRDIYIKWSDNLGDDSYSLLDRFLLVKSPRKIGLYEVNFDR